MMQSTHICKPVCLSFSVNGQLYFITENLQATHHCFAVANMQHTSEYDLLLSVTTHQVTRNYNFHFSSSYFILIRCVLDSVVTLLLRAVGW